jgi:predicted nucleotidyltransferase
MRKPIYLDPNAPMSLEGRLGSGVKAYLFGSVAKGLDGPGSDLDVYISGPFAERLENKYLLNRPPTSYKGKVYPLHLIGPSVVSETDFLRSQPEAIRVL